MDLVQATDQKYLVYESRVDPESVDEEQPPLHSNKRMWFWTDQFILAENKHDDEFLNFRVYNLLMNDSHSIRFNKSDQRSFLVEIFLFNKNIGVIVERLGALQNIISLVRINWATSEFQVIEQFERHCEIVSIVMQELTPLKFILGCKGNTDSVDGYQICKLERGKINFGEINQLNMAFSHCFDNKLFQRTSDDNEENHFSFKTYNLITKKEETFAADDFTNGDDHGHFAFGGWVCDRFYSPLCFDASIQIAWTDSKTHTWTEIDFRSDLFIHKLQFFNGHLLALSKETDYYEDYNDILKVHLIPMQRPQFLRKSAWLNIIAKLKRDNIDDPYAEAIKYLPFNADIRSPWAEDTGKEATTEQGNGDKLSGPNEQHDESNEEVPPKRFKASESRQ